MELVIFPFGPVISGAVVSVFVSSLVIVTVAVPSVILAGTVSESEAVIDKVNVSSNSTELSSVEEIVTVLEVSPEAKDIV